VACLYIKENAFNHVQEWNLFLSTAIGHVVRKLLQMNTIGCDG
jgi:hypothetical protein